MIKFLIIIFVASSICATSELSVNCHFDSQGTFYACLVTHLNITTDGVTIVSANGTHRDHDHTNHNVTAFSTHGENHITYLPNGVGKVFENLKTFSAVNCGLKFIKRENFKDMEKILFLNLGSNQIETVPEDALHDLPVVELIVFCGNNLKTLSEDLLENAKRLLHFRADLSHAETLPEKFFDSNQDLERVSIRHGKLKSIKVDFTKFQNITEIHFEGNPCTNKTFFKAQDSIVEFQQSLRETC